MGALMRFRRTRGSALRQARFAGRMHLMGDPGFFSKLKKITLKGVLKKAVPFVPFVGGPMGAVLGAMTGAAGSGKIGPLTIPSPTSLQLGIPGAGLTFPLGPAGHGRSARAPRINPRTGEPMKTRRMNILNPKALRRSMRRVEGFAHFAKRTIAFTHKVHMKKKGRKR